MEDLTFDGERVSHGACVAVGTSMTLRMWDWLLAQDLARLDVAALVERAPDRAGAARGVAAALGAGEIAQRATVETLAKHLDGADLTARLTRLIAVWPDLRKRLRAHLMPADQMRQALHLAGAPSDAAEIGVTRHDLRRVTLAARYLRSRYTLLDVLAEAGLLEQAVEAALPLA